MSADIAIIGRRPAMIGLGRRRLHQFRWRAAIIAVPDSSVRIKIAGCCLVAVTVSAGWRGRTRLYRIRCPLWAERTVAAVGVGANKVHATAAVSVNRRRVDTVGVVAAGAVRIIVDDSGALVDGSMCVLLSPCNLVVDPFPGFVRADRALSNKRRKSQIKKTNDD